MQGVLYLQSAYSMLNSLIPLEELILACKNNDYQFIALSDEFLHGTEELFDLAKKHQIRPILGTKITVNEPDQTEFLVYVKNKKGYENLLSLSRLKAENHKFHLHDLIKHQKGLIFVSAGYNSIIDQTLLYGNEELVFEYVEKYLTNFDDFYVGLSLNHEIQKNVSSKKIYDYCRNKKIKMVPVYQTCYLNDEDIEVYEALIKIADANAKVAIDAKYRLLSVKELQELYRSFPLVEEGLTAFLNETEFELPKIKYTMPIYETKQNVSGKDYLMSLARIGLNRRIKLDGIKNQTDYIKRLDYELDVICRMNFENYFLIVYDFVKYAKDQKILVGPGRGSAAGSLVAYCLGITNVDPIKYDLMFERFLNPARMSMPDIDLDFPDNKRDQVINYVKEKYGENHICSITTFGSFALRLSIRDIARVLNINNTRASAIIEAVVNNRIDNTDREVMKVLNVAKKIEGLYRQTGTHAAGIILSQQDLLKTIPMQRGAFDFYQSQYDAKTLEKLGLYKIDFLGIRNLTIITDIINNLNKQGIKIDINNIPLNDQKTYQLLSEGDTTGIFQLESQGMRNVLTKLKPNTFEDIVATLALYRPGPMENIDIYIARRNKKPFTYLHPVLEPILKRTYGIIVYQEQIMQIAQKVAGYDLFDADMLRVGISKKNHDILDKEREKFVKGTINQGYTKELANEIYDYIVKFGDYGFNRSHSVSYGLVAYQMAYLKAHYYSDFMQVLLNHVIGNESQTSEYISEAINKNVIVLPPDLNKSSDVYIKDGKTLVMPFSAIKSIGKKAVNDLIIERQKKPFSSFLEIKDRLAVCLNQKQFENLIYAGALDFLKINKKTLVENLNLTNIGYEKFIKDYRMNEFPEYDIFELTKFEKDSLGMNIKYNLFNEVNRYVNNKTIFSISDLPKNKNRFWIVGYVVSEKRFMTKNNRQMIFLTVSDGKSSLEMTVFDDKRPTKFTEDIAFFEISHSVYKGQVKHVFEAIKQQN